MRLLLLPPHGLGKLCVLCACACMSVCVCGGGGKYPEARPVGHGMSTVLVVSRLPLGFVASFAVMPHFTETASLAWSRHRAR